jgi:predicted transcriptional regulator
MAEPELKERIDRAAEAERRSKSSLIHLIVEDWLTEHNY